MLNCPRCQGTLLLEEVEDVENSSISSLSTQIYCLNCGVRYHPEIVANFLKPHVPKKSGKVGRNSVAQVNPPLTMQGIAL